MIKQATEKDISIIEEILNGAITWMEQSGCPKLWTRSDVKWEALSKTYQINDFYLLLEQEEPIGCMALTDADSSYWRSILQRRIR
ncbi:hypothetical protein lbkm_0998 [Lachnospiraceae bacterium KM106-2]|nr:hypothetical protein lbkm_0998 [Lachnospiraceae bacterium KM106-2]